MLNTIDRYYLYKNSKIYPVKNTSNYSVRVIFENETDILFNCSLDIKQEDCAYSIGYAEGDILHRYIETTYGSMLKYIDRSSMSQDIYQYLYDNIANLKYNISLDKQNKAQMIQNYMNLLSGCAHGLNQHSDYNYSIYDMFFINSYDQLLFMTIMQSGINQQLYMSRSSGLYFNLNNQSTYAYTLARPYILSGNILNKRYITNFKTNYSTQQFIQFQGYGGVFLPYEGIIQVKHKIGNQFNNITYLQTIMSNLNTSYLQGQEQNYYTNKVLDIVKYYLIIYESIDYQSFYQALQLFDQNVLISSLLYSGDINLYLENNTIQQQLIKDYIILQNSAYSNDVGKIINITQKSDQFYIANNSQRIKLISDNFNILNANIETLEQLLFQNPVNDDYKEGFAPRYDLSQYNKQFGSILTTIITPNNKTVYYGIPQSTKQYDETNLKYYRINNFTNNFTQYYPFIFQHMLYNSTCEDYFDIEYYCKQCIKDYIQNDDQCLYKYDPESQNGKQTIITIIMICVPLILLIVAELLYILYKLV